MVPGEYMTNVLIASIDGNLGYVLGKELEDEGHAVSRVPPGAELTSYLAHHPVDVVLLELMTSCLSDLLRLRTIRDISPPIHIIVFTDKIAPQERAALLTSGADRSFMKHEINDLKEYLAQHFI
jgi:CheY-like chemotaxis protein